MNTTECFCFNEMYTVWNLNKFAMLSWSHQKEFWFVIFMCYNDMAKGCSRNCPQGGWEAFFLTPSPLRTNVGPNTPTTSDMVLH